MERRWRFIYNDKNRGDTGQWAWQVHENTRMKIASLRAFATLDGCISHARENGFSFAQGYDIVFGQGAAQAREAGL